MMNGTRNKKDEENSRYTYQVSGKAAHDRIVPLLPNDWVEHNHTHRSNNNDNDDNVPDFLWENAPRQDTKQYRDNVKCYSHLPNGISILDDKWKLARLSTTINQTTNRELFLLSYCFRGKHAFQKLYDETLLLQSSLDSTNDKNSKSTTLFDLDPSYSPSSSIQNDDQDGASNFNDDINNMWVIKDANANGAGGIWIVNEDNKHTFLDEETCPFIEDHRYVCQKYAWPLRLYQGRKCHVRVYGLITSTNEAYLHRQAFLHVANRPYSSDDMRDDVHITNCCANSQDNQLFAGEICADLTLPANNDTGVVGLTEYFSSMKESFHALIQSAFPFMKGGDANHGFEYVGLDFILLSSPKGKAHLLEINCPPSQDTATGLQHAEALHDAVIQDLIHLWVLPNILPSYPKKYGGWIPMMDASLTTTTTFHPVVVDNPIQPSKATILNKLRWTLFERKLIKQQLARLTTNNHNMISNVQKEAKEDKLTNWIRAQFPYYYSNSDDHSEEQKTIFLENAGGAQVPKDVIDSMNRSLAHRHRCHNGYHQKQMAEECIKIMLGTADTTKITFGSNATSLLQQLANYYYDHNLVPEHSEIIIASENHQAHVTPWVQLAKRIKNCKIKWWTNGTSNTPSSSSCHLKDLLTERTKIVAISHCSNVLGCIRNLQCVSQLVKQQTKSSAHIVVDGVAAIPHIFPNLSEVDIDWYVISCHKLFGPHIGAICNLQQSQLSLPDVGTCNYEACAGVQGLARYFINFANYTSTSTDTITSIRNDNSRCPAITGIHHVLHDNHDNFTKRCERNDNKLHQIQNCHQQHGESSTQEQKFNFYLSAKMIENIYNQISTIETRIVNYILPHLKKCRHVCVLEGVASSLSFVEKRVPVISFYHRQISSRFIVSKCLEQNIICRHGTFLTNEVFQDEFGITGMDDGIVRLSFVHKLSEAKETIKVLQSIDNWM